MARQKEIPGTERQKIPEIDAAAEAYQAALQKRIKATAAETETRAALVAAMRAAKVSAYRDDEAGIVVTLAEGAPKVKITKVDTEGDEADEGAPAPN